MGRLCYKRTILNYKRVILLLSLLSSIPADARTIVGVATSLVYWSLVDVVGLGSEKGAFYAHPLLHAQTSTNNQQTPALACVQPHLQNEPTMSSQSQAKQVGIGSCTCACHDGIGQAASRDRMSRPTMAELHELLNNNEWEEIQNAILADATVSMRVSDSPEEDRWINAARREKAKMKGIDISSSIICNDNINEEISKDNDAQEVDEQQDEGEGQMQLRYWVEGAQDANIPNIDAGIRAANDLLQKRTLLHSLCRMNLVSNEALVVQLTHGDSDGLQTLVGAVKTAKMLIDASHNCMFLTNGDEDDGTSSKGEDAKCSSKCNDCSCHIFQHYCPPMALPPVERPQSTNSANANNAADGDQTNLQHDYNEKEDDFILHTSVLTLPDAMGNTPPQW